MEAKSDIHRSFAIDDEDKLDKAFRMITEIFRSRVADLEGRNRTLQVSLEDSKQQAQNLQQKCNQTEIDLIDAHQRIQRVTSENKDLYNTLHSMRKQLDKFERLKQSLVGSLDQHHTESLKEEIEGATDKSMDKSIDQTRQISTAPIKAKTALPQQRHQCFSPKKLETLASSGNVPLSATPGDKQSTSDTPAATIADGKLFFKTARARLSYEAFNMLLANIKRLNANEQTREETLSAAKDIFQVPLGKNINLYGDFISLIQRHH